jgi:leucyl aminopeptidase
MKILVKNKTFSTVDHELAVYFATTKKAGKKTSLQLGKIEKSFQEKINAAFDSGTFQAEFGESAFFRSTELDGAENFVVFGLGDIKKLNAESFRNLGCKLFQLLKSAKLSTASIEASSLLQLFRKPEQISVGLVEGLFLSSYSFSELKKKPEKKPKEPSEISLFVNKKTDETALKKNLQPSVQLAEATNFARWLGDRPGNLMTPKDMAKATVDKAKGTKLKVTVWDKARIKKEKMECLLGVAKGSTEEPRLIVMEYKGAAASKKPICFVGKGLTFDSGGISIKPSPKMEEMKFDMCGGSAVIGTMIAIANLKLKINAIGIVPASENMPGPSANKPGDVLKARNGKTIEVNNTDAEGRLILADALCLASEKKPSAIIDAATLTGAMTIALGDTHTGYFTYDDKLAKAINNASEITNERVWQMPMAPEHLEDMKGAYGDLSNMSSVPGAGSAHAAVFLYEFVDSAIPWAHFDIAGTAWNCGHRQAYMSKKGATGVMVRTFVELAKSWK